MSSVLKVMSRRQGKTWWLRGVMQNILDTTDKHIYVFGGTQPTIERTMAMRRAVATGYGLEPLVSEKVKHRVSSLNIYRPEDLRGLDLRGAVLVSDNVESFARNPQVLYGFLRDGAFAAPSPVLYLTMDMTPDTWTAGESAVQLQRYLTRVVHLYNESQRAREGIPDDMEARIEALRIEFAELTV